ncbi:MAG: mechanosensitive ion channel family protein [Flavipsychrobacter sp.]|nr:mechanosensitive ion channel family protein [Flavipsychrobacter sp.]
MYLTLLAINWQNFESKIGGEKISNLLWCVGIIVATLLVKKPLAKLIAKSISSITNRFTDKKHGAVFCNLIQSPLEALLQTILFYIAINQLNALLNNFLLHRIKDKHEELAIRFSDIADHVFLFLVILFSTIALSRILDFIYHVQMDDARERDNKERQQLLPILKDVMKVVLWTIGAFWVLGTVFHVNIPALITGLGIGGVAIALAAKESIENLFGAFTILTDKPFQVGDIIKLGSVEGTVERIGFRSTRLRATDGSAITIPNKKLVYENLENLSNRYNRKVKLVINIKYGITHFVLQQVVKDIRASLQHTLYVTDPIEILVEGFAENVFQLVISYGLPAPLPSGANLIDIKHQVNTNIYGILVKHQAFPAENKEIPVNNTLEVDNTNNNAEES